ncbi:MAG: tetratricopeptide repeat protein, partial [Psychrosphaera sp.]|nr:tetratricopeptide repeat protein [Psychrosphaera sp.]
MKLKSLIFTALLGLGTSLTAVAEQASLRSVYYSIDAEKWTQVIAKLDKILKDDDQYADAWYLYVDALFRNGDYTKAIQANQKLTSFKGYDQYAEFYSAMIYGIQGQNDKAQKHLDAANKAGYVNYDKLKTEAAFAGIRKQGKIDFAPEQNYKVLTAQNGVKIPYTVLLPNHFDQNKTYKALLAYPDGSGGKASADWSIKHLWKNHEQYKDWIVIVPVAPKDGWINHPSHHALNDLMKHMRKEYKVKDNLFHALGYRSGSRPAVTFSRMSQSYFTSVTTVGAYMWENWKQKDLTRFGDMPVTMYVAKTDEAGLEINRQAN